MRAEGAGAHTAGMRSDDDRTLGQRVALFLLPLQRWKRGAIAESREWMRRCKACDRDQSVWDAGGVRFNARGNKREYGVCPHCEQASWLVLHHPARSPLRR